MSLPTGSDLRQRTASLTVSFDGKAYVLGRPDLGIFVAVPEPGAVFVTTLQETGSTAEAVARASEVAGEEVDGADFLDGLTAAGLLDPPASDATRRSAGGREIRWIEGIGPRAAGRLFGKAGWSLYGAAMVFAAVVLVARDDLRPTWADAWFLSTPALSILAYVPLSMLFSAIHEAWHWLAGRALGVPAIFRVSHRGTYLVFETDLTQIVTLPRRRRYGAFLAGIAIDSVILATALGLRLLHDEQMIALNPTVNALLGTVVLYQTVAIVWQGAALPLRSDGYAIVANALSCHNLYRTTWLTAKKGLLRLTEAEETELAAAGEWDQRMARWFVVPYVGGIVVMIWMFATVVIPLVIAMAGWMAPILTSWAVTSVAFWEAVAMATYLGLTVGLPLVLAFRERRMRRAGRFL